jgi:beta-1,4-mannosyltransferase
MRVLFAPDWREGNPYQDLLAQALQRHDVSVDFLTGYRRILPLGRSAPNIPTRILHLHWPEAYFSPRSDGFDWSRHARFCLDLEIALRNKVLAYTAHNLLPHSRRYQGLVELNIKYVARRARLIFVHSSAAKSLLVSRLGAQGSRIKVVPHGDLSVVLGPPIPRADALRALGLSSAPLALMFGVVDPYKSCEEIIQWWRRNNPPINLAIVGKPMSPQYQDHIQELIGDAPNIITSLGWLSDSQLRVWLSAASVVVFNYRQILTSGAACLARSYGIPIVLPKRLDTVDLGERTPYVRRFVSVEDDFGDQLQAASMVAPNFDEAAQWREACSWDRVARLTAEAYSKVEGV